MTDHSSLQKEKNNTDIVERLPPCPLCGGEKGYSLHEGATYRWWDVQCSNCGRVVDECASDRRTNLGSVLPERWKAADAVWSESAKYAEGMRAEITRLRAEAEELRSVMIAAAEEIQAHWPAHCDAEGYGPANLMRRLEEGIPSQYAYTAGDFERLRAEAEALRNALTVPFAYVLLNKQGDITRAMRRPDRWMLSDKNVVPVYAAIATTKEQQA